MCFDDAQAGSVNASYAKKIADAVDDRNVAELCEPAFSLVNTAESNRSEEIASAEKEFGKKRIMDNSI